jgi:hypothetical protein
MCSLTVLRAWRVLRVCARPYFGLSLGIVRRVLVPVRSTLPNSASAGEACRLYGVAYNWLPKCEQGLMRTTRASVALTLRPVANMR